MYTIVYVRLYDSTRVIEYCVYIDHISCMKVYILEYTEKNKCSLDRARAGSDRVSPLARARYTYIFIIYTAVLHLIQPSSAAAERIFTQLKKIVDACGESMLPDMLEFRLFQRCNRE